jgi:hemolysin activation/secretion protein
VSGRPELNFYASRSTTDTGIKLLPRHLVTQTSFITIVSQDSGEDVTLNEGFGTALSLPLPEKMGIRSTLTLGADFKRFRLSSFNTNNFYISTVITNASGSQTIENTVSSGQPRRLRDVDYLPMNVGWNTALPDSRGATLFNASVALNVPVLSSDADFGHAAYSTNASASYWKFNAGLSREQKIYHDWSVLLHANGQYADGPLIGNEQFAMGGLAGVRGYLDGAAYGDSGWQVQIEPRTPLYNLGLVDGTAPFWVRGAVFMDYGELYRYDPTGNSNIRHQNFWGVGCSITANIGDHLDARITIAEPLLHPSQAVEAHGSRMYFSLGVQF